MLEDKIYLDKEGYQDYKNSIDNLFVNLGRVEERMNVLNETNGSLIEYDELLNLKESIKERIKIKRNNLSKIVIVEKSENEKVLNIGDLVKINTYYGDEMEEEICELVTTESTLEDDIEKTNINSPKGKILLGSTIGDTKYFEIEKQKIRVDILEKINKRTLKKVL